MAIKTPTWLKSLFVTGYKPTQQDFADVFDSFVPRSEADLRTVKITTVLDVTPVLFSPAFPAGTTYVKGVHCTNSQGSVWYKITSETNAGFTLETEIGASFECICAKTS